MRIGLLSPFDLKVLLPVIKKQEDRELIEQYSGNHYATAVHTYCMSLLKSGHFVRLFTLAQLSFTIKQPDLEIIAIKSYTKYPWKYLWGEFINAELIKQQICQYLDDIDILHSQWTYCYAYAAGHFCNKKPVYCTIRDWTPYIWKIESLKNKITWSFRWVINELVMRNSKIHFIANSTYLASMVKHKYHRDITVIFNSVSKKFLKQDNKPESDQLQILCISSSNDKRKNIKTLLMAFQILLDEYPKAELMLAGSPFIDGNNVVEKWRSQHLLKNVVLLGHIAHDNLIRYIDSATVFVSPSLEETFGNTFPECMARRTPVVGGTKSGAIPFVLNGGESGFLCDVTNPQNISDTIKYVYENRQDALQKSDNAFKRLLSFFDEDIICRQYIDLYSQNL